MAVIDSLILSVCMGASGQANDACTKALVAGTKQAGIEQSMNSYEQNRLNYLQTGAESYMGKDAVAVFGGTAWLANSIVHRKAAFGLPNLGICDSIKFEFNSNVEKLIFQWRF